METIKQEEQKTMIKTYINTDPAKVDDFVNNYPEKVWATQTQTIEYQGQLLHKAVIFYGEK